MTAPRSLLRWLCLALLLGAGVLSCGKEQPDPQGWRLPVTVDPGTHDAFGPIPAAVEGFAVTRGAAPGYIEDRSCRECHEELYDSYQEVGMGRSFYPPDPSKAVEDFDKPFYHEPSRRWYVMRLVDGRYRLSRYRLDAQGQRYAEFSAEVAWVIGSGNHVRSYLARSESGHLFELPLSWFKGLGWGMSPGYDGADHEGFGRVINRGCMFCHNAYPEVPAGADRLSAPDVFPERLPHGIGCQRCHGPGARHVQAAMAEDPDDAEIRRRILNPKHFAKEQRQALCATCHLQPDSEHADLVPRWHDRHDYGHRPDQHPREHIAFLEYGNKAQVGSRLQINHHGYRLRQSRCATEAELDCLTCHDPHRVVPVAERPAFYRSKCTTCHQLEACTAPQMGRDIVRAQADCARCHMPRSRPSDAIRVTITDHRIARPQPGVDPAAPRQPVAREPRPIDVRPFFAKDQGRVAAYLGYGNLSAPSPAKMQAWLRGFRAARPQPEQGYVQVGSSMAGVGAGAEAVSLLEEGLQVYPESLDMLEALGSAYLSAQRPKDALAVLLRAQSKGRRSARFSRVLADAFALTGARKQARAAYEASLAQRSNNWLSWRQHGSNLAALQDYPAALEAMRRAAALNPDDLSAYEVMADILEHQQDWRQLRKLLAQAGTHHPALQRRLISHLLLVAHPPARDPQLALQLAQKLCAAQPRDGAARLHLALACTLLRRPAAGEELQRAARDGADPAGIAALRSLQALGRGDQAGAEAELRIFRKALSKPGDAYLRRSLRGFLQAMGADLGR